MDFGGAWKILLDFKSNPDLNRGVLEHKKAPVGRDSIDMKFFLGDWDSDPDKRSQSPLSCR